MAPIRHWRRIPKIAGIAALCLLAAVFAGIRIELQLVRSRTERLLADVRQFQLRRGTWEDVRAFQDYWGSTVSSDGSCTPKTCILWVSLQEPLGESLGSVTAKYPSLNFLNYIYFIINPRLPHADAKIVVQDSIVTESRFKLWVQVPKGMSPDAPDGYGLVGIATQHVKGFTPYDFGVARLHHSEYWIGKPGGCTTCIKLMTDYTPLVGRAKMLELTDFDLSCITRWSPCTKEADLMPYAGKEYAEESKESGVRSDELNHCQVPFEFWGREVQTIAIADVISKQPFVLPKQTFVLSDWDFLTANLRLIHSLKGSVQWPLNEIETASIYDRGQRIPGWSSADLMVGRRYILLGDFVVEKSGKKVLALDDCGVIPYTEQNLAAIRRGIDEASARRSKLRELGFTSDETAQ